MKSEAKAHVEHPSFLVIFLAGLLVSFRWAEHVWYSNYQVFSVFKPHPGPRTQEHVPKK